jgi:ribosomal protein S18 acetylase RimI-like enzyme
MTIRIATLRDAPAITSLVIAFRDFLLRLAPSDVQAAQGIEMLLRASDTQIFIACDEEQAIGYVIQRYRPSMWDCGMEATLEDLFVDAAARQHGVGQALADFAVKTAADRGCTAISLNTNEFNVAASKIYSKLGFDAVSKRWQGRQIFYRRKIERGVPE